ncbi:MAG: RND family transporter, partial [Methanoregulaceae archaeon]
MEILFEKLAGFLIRRPKVIAAFIIVLIAISLYGMTSIAMDTSWKTYMQPDSAEGIIYNQYDQTYSSSSIILIVETDEPTSPVVLTYLDRLETTLLQQQNIVSASSIVDLMKLYNNGTVPTTQADVDRIVNQIPPATRNLYMSSN